MFSCYSSSRFPGVFLLLLLWFCSSTRAAASTDLVQLPFINYDLHAGIDFLSEWQGLGPFRIGTREAAWGVDPLEAYGGFASLPYNKTTRFASSLTANATLGWRQHYFTVDPGSSNKSEVLVEIAYHDVDWVGLRDIYGWAALQYQAWLRGTLQNHWPYRVKVQLYAENVLEYHVNQRKIYGGDFYSLRRAPLVLMLEPGDNIVELRMIRDVRALGGPILPAVSAKLRVSVVNGSGCRGLQAHLDKAIFPTVVEKAPVSRFASLTFTNSNEEMVTVYRCPATPDTAQLLTEKPLEIASGQTRALAYLLPARLSNSSYHVSICYSVQQTEALQCRHEHNESPPFSQGIFDAQKMTFLHPSGAVSYAILKPPAKQLPASEIRPLLLYLHGSGVEVDLHREGHMLDSLTELEAFTLFPSGMTSWGSDDWHVWGMADALAAIDAVHDWVQSVAWRGVRVLTDRVVVVGHSNGGQATWFFATHMSQRTIAAAPVSGFVSVETYVPLTFWTEADPAIDGILYASRNSYRHELFIDNLECTPILVQHGVIDSNVPIYHSRLISSLLTLSGQHHQFVELPGKGHWYDTVMTTEPMQAFYEAHLGNEPRRPDAPARFSVVSSATNEFGSRYGLTIQLLEDPSQLGRADVEIEIYDDNKTMWTLTLSNAYGISINFTEANPPPSWLKFRNGARIFDMRSLNSTYTQFSRSEGQWEYTTSLEAPSSWRTGRQRGAMEAIMRTNGPLQLVSCGGPIDTVLQVSLNLFSYYGTDSEILPCGDYGEALQVSGNLITFATGADPPPAMLDSFPISFTQWAITLRTNFQKELFPFAEERIIGFEPGLGLLMVRPLAQERLELLVWGYDIEGLQRAARLLPTLTGTGQPDFVVLGSKSRSRGAAGTLAMGFFNYSWNISRSSYLP